MENFSPKNYAQAIYQSAKAAHTTDTVLDSLKTADEIINFDTDFRNYLNNPFTDSKQKEKYLDEFLGSSVAEDIKEVLFLILNTGDIANLKNIIKEFEKIKKIEENTMEARIESAVELSKEQEKSIISILKQKTGKNIIVTTIVKSEMIGGIRIILDNEKIIDFSIQDKITRLKQYLTS